MKGPSPNSLCPTTFSTRPILGKKGNKSVGLQGPRGTWKSGGSSEAMRLGLFTALSQGH